MMSVTAVLESAGGMVEDTERVVLFGCGTLSGAGCCRSADTLCMGREWSNGGRSGAGGSAGGSLGMAGRGLVGAGPILMVEEATCHVVTGHGHGIDEIENGHGHG